MPDSKRIGIVTVTYNSGQVIDDFIKSLLAQNYSEFVLYIIENASTDDTRERIAAFPDPRIVLLANTQNNGIAGGNNQGIQAAFAAGCGDILLINNDIIFEPDLLTGLIADLDISGGDMIVPKIYYHDVPNKIWCAGGRFIRWLGYANRHDGQDELDQGQYETIRQIEYSPTCCMLIKKAVFDKIGLFDETYFVYFDDTDYCFRAMKAGLKLMYTPHVSLLHKVSSLTGGDESPFSIRMSARNKVYFMRKNLSRLISPLWIVIYEIYLFLRLLGRKDTVPTFRLRQQSFFAGLSLQPKK